ncbi:RidA family protein [Ancylobacter terrae]|uniref:RidA family protein n=1 Tax=Ancylobacter sp. sgz301288 TaxID=3342077 RepID=UPI0038597E12
MSHDFDQRLAALGAEVPNPTVPGANYVPAVIVGNIVFLAGQVPRRDNDWICLGRHGENLTIEQGVAGARLCALNLIVQLREACGGSLARVRRIVKLTGFVNATPDFVDMAKVVNGASDTFIEIFGEAGRHARSAVGVATLPRGCGVEIEAIAEIDV